MAGKTYSGYGRGTAFAKAAAKQSVQQMKQGVIAKVTPVSGGKPSGPSSYVGVGGGYTATPGQKAPEQPSQAVLQKKFAEQKLEEEKYKAVKSGKTLKEQLLTGISDSEKTGRSEQELNFMAARQFLRASGSPVTLSNIYSTAPKLEYAEKKVLERKTLSQQFQTTSGKESRESQPTSVSGSVFDISDPLGLNVKRKPTQSQPSVKSGINIWRSDKPFDWSAYSPKRLAESYKSEFSAVKEKGVIGTLNVLGSSLKSGVKPFLFAHGGEIAAPLIGVGIKSFGILKATTYEKILPVEKIIDFSSKVSTKTKLPKSALITGLSVTRNVGLDLLGSAAVTYGVKKSIIGLTEFTPEETEARKLDNYAYIKAKAKYSTKESFGGVLDSWMYDIPLVPLYSKKYKETYEKQLELSAKEVGVGDHISGIKSSALKELKGEQYGFLSGVWYSGTASELRGTYYVSKTAIKQSQGFISRMWGFGKPIGYAGIGEGVGTLTSYDVSQGNKFDYKNYKSYSRYGVAAGTGFLSAGIIGGFIPAAKSSTSKTLRFSGDIVNIGANILDPIEKPTDMTAHLGVNPIRKRAGYNVPVSTMIMDITPPATPKSSPFSFNFGKGKGGNSIVQNVNKNVPPTQTNTKQNVFSPIFSPININTKVSSPVNVPITPETNIPVQIKIRENVPVPVNDPVSVPMPVNKPVNIPINQPVDLPVKQPISTEVPISVVTPRGFGSGLFLPFGGLSGQSKGKSKRRYSYAPSFEALLMGIRGRKPKTMGGLFTGQELRPIIGGSVTRKKYQGKKKKKVARQKVVKKKKLKR